MPTRRAPFPGAVRNLRKLLLPALLVPLALSLLLTAGRAADPARMGERQQHLALLGVPAWHAARVRGQGIRVALIDSGLRGYRAQLGKALPRNVIVRSFRLDGNLEGRDSQHGILCGEILHAVAPDAELLLANWEPGRPDTFLQAVRWARAQGAKVVSCSCVMPDWSDGDGGGAVHEELARVLGSGQAPGDMLFVAAAGNLAQRHWSGVFHAGPGGWHEWRPSRTMNAVNPWGDEDAFVELYGRPGAAYELQVEERVTGTVVARAVTGGLKDRTAASVHFWPEPGASYAARVRLLAGAPGRFHLVALHGGLEITEGSSSVAFPADGKDVLAVGAVTDGRRCRYSSCGPNSPRPKPDLVAPVPFPTLCRTSPFGGTSAAAPQAAGLAALCWCRHPDWPAARVRSALQAAARDLGPPGHDWETGYGLVRLP
jgi:subtilisin family serine protease